MTDPERPNATEGAAAPSADPPPVKPVEPDAGDCCGQGCVPCIFDFYEDALTQYYEALAAWQERHPGQSPD